MAERMVPLMVLRRSIAMVMGPTPPGTFGEKRIRKGLTNWDRDAASIRKGFKVGTAEYTQKKSEAQQKRR